MMNKNNPPLTLDQLRDGQRVRGIVPNQTVTIKHVDRLDDVTAEVIYCDEAGHYSPVILTPDRLARVEIVTESGDIPAFDGNADDFRLVAEALRITYAARHDPMVAVNSSDVDPLPHQIRAVYEELLPRVPLRFLLADDPGAGKTIMAGLYLKELILRSSCERAIIVVPGGLVEQWRDELAQKFDLHFEVFNATSDDSTGKNPFEAHPYLIVRMDQIARNDRLMRLLEQVKWDVAIVDEAHRMAAHYSLWAGEINATKRFKLGQLLSETAHNFLLMTATPHSGKEEDFQSFMSLLDRDRFEGQYRQGIHRTDTKGLMRRMVKEDLLTLDGRPLFPERRAYTVPYELSRAERDLYEQVSDYVRDEMGKADAIQDGKRRNNVGFALMVLQRRLASSPEAILRSLERRKAKLRRSQREYDAPNDYDSAVSETNWAELEQQVDEVVDRATAAQDQVQLTHEIAVLDGLIATARRVRNQDEDRKWVELRKILESKVLTGTNGENRKIIIFTEHRDTLTYLEDKITTQLGSTDAVVTIHGGTPRHLRQAIREQFAHDPRTLVLLATDAAGEGLNLQRAHLMVNYDLPWNPNRIEQRFGRIHRIGQREVCHLWNLVAHNTREGDVFNRLLEKIEVMSEAYNGNLFNVLGDTDSFDGRPLKDLLIEAIRYGDQPETRQWLDKVIDASVSKGLDELRAKRALSEDIFSSRELDQVRNTMRDAEERKLQPGFIRSFFIPAFKRLRGLIDKRESGCYKVTYVPPLLRDIASRQYECVTFDVDYKHPAGTHHDAALIAPGHPLLDAVLVRTTEDLKPTLAQGTIFVDRSSKQLATPALLYIVEQRITAGGDKDTLYHHFDYLLVPQDGDTNVNVPNNGGVTVTTTPPFLDYDTPKEEERAIIQNLMRDPMLRSWLRKDHGRTVTLWATREGIQPRMKELEQQRRRETQRVWDQVENRLTTEINYWERMISELRYQERNGHANQRLGSKDAAAKVADLEQRLELRKREKEQASWLNAGTPLIRGVALVIPGHLIDAHSAPNAKKQAATFAKETQEVERRAVEAALAAERALGRVPEEMPRNNPGFDIRSTDPADPLAHRYYLEVKGRIAGSNTFTITNSEINFAQNHKDTHRLVLVSVHPDGPEFDEVRYVMHAFDDMEASMSTHSRNEKWSHYWGQGGAPV
ncbi:helicase C-terminal domain protein [Corynebacterium matruchotii ATCC 14266]|uniref:Helicase C-terminal domain protein n=2 Tax=Corynebacterium matruchotii TaxID=43768 RepID=E0DH22_9CORY|nr:helicase C-terminal domain protein [Corynebacterium matruchotii ATCC 14266]